MTQWENALRNNSLSEEHSGTKNQDLGGSYGLEIDESVIEDGKAYLENLPFQAGRHGQAKVAMAVSPPKPPPGDTEYKFLHAYMIFYGSYRCFDPKLVFAPDWLQ